MFVGAKATMFEAADPTSGGTTEEPNERLARAAQLYREFRARCFWHSPPDLIITEELIPFVVKGLRKHGGRRGFLLAGTLQTPSSLRE
jgi:hypothetical protein